MHFRVNCIGTISDKLNYFLRGLICAKEFGEAFPELRKKIFVPSSIYSTSKQVSVMKSKSSRKIAWNLVLKKIQSHQCTKEINGFYETFRENALKTP